MWVKACQCGVTTSKVGLIDLQYVANTNKPWYLKQSARLFEMDLLECHDQLSKLICPQVPDTLRDHWLWALNLKEEVTASAMLNESHLTALVLCRVAGLSQPVIDGSASSLFGDVAVVQQRYQDLSMRELHDSVEHAQMHMHQLISNPNYREHLNRLFARLGQLLLPLPETPEIIFDDNDSLEVAHDGATTHIMSSTTIRWFFNVFVVLFRHVEMRRVAQPPIAVGPKLELKSYHIEAATDMFYQYTQYYDLPPGAALQYACDFGQMLNSVTQITFFYFPDYVKRNQITDEEVASGDNAIYTLAPALAMLPHVTVVHEDDVFTAAPGVIGHPAHAAAGFRVILGAGTVMLLTPTGHLFFDDNVLEMLRVVPVQ